MKTHSPAHAFLSFAAAVAVGAGCSSSQPTAAKHSVGPSPEGAVYLLASEPQGAINVKDAKADAKSDQQITMVGRIGGDVKPWIEKSAAFFLVDTSLKPCNETHDDGCKTPWDYCCDAGDLPANKALVKVVNTNGEPIAVDARHLLGVKELQTVVVRGVAKRDEAGNLTLLADGVFVRN